MSKTQRIIEMRSAGASWLEIAAALSTEPFLARQMADEFSGAAILRAIDEIRWSAPEMWPG
jgi:hypothetical protein